MGVLLDRPWIGQQFSPPTRIDIATIEAAIVTRLRAMVPSIEIVHFPDAAKNYRLTHRIGAALVVYRGATYGQVEDTAAIIQERKLEFDVTVLVRDLGWSVGGTPGGTSPGSYAILESIRAALTGYQVPGARKIFLVSEKFVERDHEGGVWIYLISIALMTIAVEPSTIDEFPLFIKGVAEEGGGESTVTIGATQFTFNSLDQIQLPNRNLIAVTVSAIGGSAFVLGSDFTIDPVNGIVTRIVVGAIAHGASVNVAWSYADSVIASAGESSPLS
jgi:hypothetical protein